MVDRRYTLAAVCKADSSRCSLTHRPRRSSAREWRLDKPLSKSNMGFLVTMNTPDPVKSGEIDGERAKEAVTDISHRNSDETM